MDDGDGSERTERAGRDRKPERDPSDGSESSADSTPVAVGDGRKKYVSVTTRAGERREHGDVFLKHSSVAFLISSDVSFPDSETTRYSKADLRRVEVTQHHAACFITTATAGEGPALDTLREFRDGSLSRSAPGRALISVYYTASPPIAATLSRHPEAATTRVVRWLVGRCATLATRRKRASPVVRAVLTLALVALYVFGVGCAALGHLAIRLREGFYEKNR